MFRRIRILFLLLILLFVGLGTYLDQYFLTRWKSSALVALYPVNGDGSALSQTYIENLKKEDFGALVGFFKFEAKGYGLPLDKPIEITLAPVLNSLPPKPPTSNPSVVEVMFWSLRLRWWAWRTPPNPPGPTPRIRLFLLFYDPNTHDTLDHSTGLSKGRLGIVNLFATKKASGSNQVVIAHELLHTLGATDKYDLGTTQPLFPSGYAEPDAAPRFPQQLAELMGGRVPLTPTESKIPDSLSEVIIGADTAAEIGWVKN